MKRRVSTIAAFVTIVTAVAIMYAHYQGLSQVQSIFFGVGPAVMAIIAIAAYKLARSTNKRDPILWSIAAIVCAFFLHIPSHAPSAAETLVGAVAG